MFKLTDKAKAFNRFIIQHTACGDYNLSNYSSLKEAVKCEANDVGCSEKEIAATVKLYSAIDVIEAAADGYGWPLALSLVEEVDENTTMSNTTMNTKIKMSFSQQLATVRANSFAILEIEAPHIAAIREAVRINPQLIDNVLRALPYNYVAANFRALESILICAIKQLGNFAHRINAPYYFDTFAVHAALKAVGVSTDKRPSPFSHVEAIGMIS
ncbi:MAG: hypothetical protein ACMV0I_09370 [Pseudomonas sp.]